MGGLARRASLFSRLRQEAPERTLFLSGPEEFQKGPGRDEGLQVAQGLVRGFSMLGYGLSYVLPHEAAWLRSHGQDLPACFAVVNDTPVTRVLQTPEGSVGVVLVPALAPGRARPDQAALDAVLEAGRKLRPKVRLLAAVLPYSTVGTVHFQERAGGLFDLYLGGGAVGTAQKAADDAVWMRPHAKGKSVAVVRVHAWPQSGKARRWRTGDQVDFGTVYLTQEYAGDPAMRALFP